MSKEQNKDLFYTQSYEEVLKNLDSSIEGLSTAQAQERLATYGRNELEEGEKRSLLAKFLDQFKDLMIIILLAAAALSKGRKQEGQRLLDEAKRLDTAGMMTEHIKTMKAQLKMPTMQKHVHNPNMRNRGKFF